MSKNSATADDVMQRLDELPTRNEIENLRDSIEAMRDAIEDDSDELDRDDVAEIAQNEVTEMLTHLVDDDCASKECERIRDRIVNPEHSEPAESNVDANADEEDTSKDDEVEQEEVQDSPIFG